jgi:hypothetical protein
LPCFGPAFSPRFLDTRRGAVINFKNQPKTGFPVEKNPINLDTAQSVQAEPFWEFFEKTGSILAYLSYLRQSENLEAALALEFRGR